MVFIIDRQLLFLKIHRYIFKTLYHYLIILSISILPFKIQYYICNVKKIIVLKYLELLFWYHLIYIFKFYFSNLLYSEFSYFDILNSTITLNKSPSISILNFPPWSSTILFEIASPNPEPSVCLDSSPLLNLSVISSTSKFNS